MRPLALLAACTLAGCGGAPSDFPASDGGAGAPDLAVAAPAPDLATAAPAPDLAPATVTRTIKLEPSFKLAPGEEAINCYYVPPDGEDRYVSRIVVDMNPGSHHLVVFRIKDAQGMPASGPFPCTQVDIPDGFDGLLPGAQEPHTEHLFPDGVAVKVSREHGLLFQSHYLNASAKDTIESGVSYRMTMVPADQVKAVAGMIFLSNWSLKVPPGVSTQSKSCRAPADMKVLSLTGHMHKRGVAFDALLGGMKVYHTDKWDEPAWAHFPAPGLDVKAGTDITYACTYSNPTNKTLRFGNSAATDEMCILGGLYYPTQDGATLFFCP